MKSIDNWIYTRKGLKEWKNTVKEYSKYIPRIIEWARQEGKYDSEIEYYIHHGFESFPYEWTNRIRVIKDCKMYKDGNYSYILRDGKKLFLDSKKSYAQLYLEQHERSPHLYFANSFCIPKESILVDIGASEGMISLDNIETIKKTYLIESDSRWVELEKQTFAPWIDKVHMISKYVSNQDDDNNITLDNLLKNESDVIVLKIDVEGMEEVVLEGAKDILKNKKCLVSIAAYHNEGDDIKFEKFFKELGYETEFSEGYAYLYYDKAPFLRKGILRAKNY